MTNDAPHPHSGPYETSLAHLEDVLTWIELRCKVLILRRELEKNTKNDEFSHRWSQFQDKSPQALRDKLGRLEDELQANEAAMETRQKATDEAGKTLAIEELSKLYGLNEFERTIILLAAAPAFSQRFAQLYGQLQDGYETLTVEAVFNFFALSFAERITHRDTFAKSSRLVQNDLISIDVASRFNAPQDLLHAQIQISNRTFGFLVDNNNLMDEFMEFSSVEEPHSRLEQVVLKEDDKRRIKSVIERHDKYLRCRKEWGFDDVITYGRGVLMLFYGKPGTGKTMMAHAVANEMGKRLLNVDLPTFIDHHQANRFLPALFREARMQDAVLFFDECEVLFGDRRNGNVLMTMLLTEIERFEGVAILATNLPQYLDEALDRRILVKVAFPEPDRVARREIWDKHLPDAAPLADDVDLDLLADRFEMTGGYIKNAVLTAVADAVHTNGEDPQITMASLERSASAQVAPALDEHSPLVDPKVRLDEVVLPPTLRARVEEIIDAARHRRTILERWKIGQNLSYGKGVSALFYGQPGTGKTMCAEAIANELNRPLLAASVTGLKSKWVGETEQNLASLFRDAAAHNAVLFLDEADSLIMARGEGRASRHDDAAVNVLLTHVERHNGVVLLATNRPQILDPALDRRITYTLEFPRPNARERAQIWKTLLPEDVPTEGALDFDALGEQFLLTGALIKNAVFKAAFRAARADKPITMALLEEAALEEQGEKDAAPIGFSK